MELPRLTWLSVLVTTSESLSPGHALTPAEVHAPHELDKAPAGDDQAQRPNHQILDGDRKLVVFCIRLHANRKQSGLSPMVMQYLHHCTWQANDDQLCSISKMSWHWRITDQSSPAGDRQLRRSVFV